MLIVACRKILFMFKTAKNNLIHWIAIVSIVMASLAPAISQAVAISQHGQGISIEICTTSGMKMTQVIVDEQEGQNQLTNEACPYCVVHQAYLLPLDKHLNFAEPQAYHLYPKLFYQSPKPIFAWVSLPSRAPPQLA